MISGNSINGILLIDNGTIGPKNTLIEGNYIGTDYAGMAPADIKAKYFTPADNTHTSPAGAERNAASVVEGIRALKDCPLAGYLLDKPETKPAPAR